MTYLPLVGIIVGSIAGLVFMAGEALFGGKALAVILSIGASLVLTGVFLEKATLASILGLLIKYHSLLLVPSRSIPFILIAAHAFSRFAAGSLATSPQNETNTRNNMLMAGLGMVPLLLVGSLLFLLLIPLLWVIRTLTAGWLAAKHGGLTKKRLLHTQHVVEICFYMLVVVAYGFAFGSIN